MTRLENGIEGLMRAIMALLACALIAAVLLNAANVVDRYVFGQAIVGAEEVQIYLMIWITFLGAAVVSWRNRHLRMDVLVRHLPPWLQRTVAIIDRLLLLAIAGFVTVQSFRFVRQMLVIDRRSEAADIPMAVPHSAILVGFGLICIVALLHVFGVRGRAPATVDRH